LDTHFQARTGPFAGDIREIDFSPDGDWLVALNDDNLTTLWNVETGKQHTFLPENARIQGFVSFNTLLLDDETHFVFDLQTGEQANLPAIFDEVSLFPANPGSSLLVSWDDGTLHFYGVPSQQAL
jgi:WD40 repeat protein